MVKLSRGDVLCQCAGGAGAIVSCVGMMVSLAAGLLRATGSTLARSSGMAGMGAMGSPTQAQAGTHPFLTLLNHVAVPLLFVSILLMLLGVVHAGRRPLELVAAGSALLVVNMFISTSPLVAALLLVGGYFIVFLGYVAAWKVTATRRGIPARS